MTGLIGKVAGLAIPSWVKLAIPGALALVLAFTWMWGNGWKKQAGLYEAKLSEVAAVQEMQNVKLEAWAKSIERHSKEIADNAQRKYEAGVAAGNAATERYIASHRVRAPQDYGGAILAPSIATPDSASSSDGPGDDAELVAVSADDVRICTTNSLRLKAVQEWALSLGE